MTPEVAAAVEHVRMLRRVLWLERNEEDAAAIDVVLAALAEAEARVTELDELLYAYSSVKWPVNPLVGRQQARIGQLEAALREALALVEALHVDWNGMHPWNGIYNVLRRAVNDTALAGQESGGPGGEPIFGGKGAEELEAISEAIEAERERLTR